MTHSTAFSTIDIDKLFQLIDSEYQSRREIFGIPEANFFRRDKSQPFAMQIFGQRLDTPVGVAAGPHTQMAQNIIAAWLCGASYIELKTIQTLDELEISKPCIDMQDEGYNCEWSQELRITESFDEYLKAWILIHVLQHKFGFKINGNRGFVFNMSVGYNYEGILKPNVQWYFDQMRDCSEAKKNIIAQLRPLYPEIDQIDFPDCISDNITLSTMHGCPPDEIEKIGHYLLSEKKLHTLVKLNPTLLGKDELRDILNNKLKFKTTVPDIAFEHDLKYPDAIGIIERLQATASANGLFFGVKLTNTLESLNNKTVFPPDEKMMYMSGRALHPISVNVARKLQNRFDGKLNISFSAGADCFNINELVNSGLKPVTVCSDLLKPGGYTRLSQYTESLSANSFAGNALQQLNAYADAVLENEAYHRDPFVEKSIKTRRPLGHFDCIHAPCVDECPTNQDIPEYMFHTAAGRFDAALDVALAKNPMPNVLGTACDHICQTRCTRINYDQPLKIRGIKPFIAANGRNTAISLKPALDKKAAVIGAGPSGLSCAYFLQQAGFGVEIFETKDVAGGMVADAIPGFRMQMSLLEKDVERIISLGVKVHFNSAIDKESFAKLQQEFDFVYIAAGAQRFKTLQLEGDHAAGVLNPFDFLKDAKAGKPLNLGKNILVIGGGNTAMDVARTAKRLAGDGASVKILYRRTIFEMPADREEIEAVLHENIEIAELLAPEKIVISNGHITAIQCARMKLVEGKPGERPYPVKIEGETVEFAADSIIPALGQEISIDFADPDALKTAPGSYQTGIPNVFIGGDAMRGAATIVKAVGDGRKAAIAIAAAEGIVLPSEALGSEKNLSVAEMMARKSRRMNMDPTIADPVPDLSAEQAIAEASRCLYCGDVCNICVTVCPNRANHYYRAESAEIPVWRVKAGNGEPEISAAPALKISQKIQVFNIADFCNECGNCTTFCPSNGAPFSDKPRICLTQKSFDQTDNSYYFTSDGEVRALLFHQGGDHGKLLKMNDSYRYISNKITAVFSKDDFRLLAVEKLSYEISEITLGKPAEMKFLMENLPEYIS